MDPTTLTTLRQLIRENDVPYFSEEELELYFTRYSGDIEATVHYCLLIKAEDTTLSVSGLSTGDTSKYYRRLASLYRPNNSGVLRGVF